MDEALSNADQMITNLLIKCGKDYSAHREQLASEIWDSGLWEGNDEVVVSVGHGLPDLRVIQEDHYDQHMDEDENKPSWDEMILSNPEYTWFCN